MTGREYLYFLLRDVRQPSIVQAGHNSVGTNSFSVESAKHTEFSRRKARSSVRKEKR